MRKKLLMLPVMACLLLALCGIGVSAAAPATLEVPTSKEELQYIIDSIHTQIETNLPEEEEDELPQIVYGDTFTAEIECESEASFVLGKYTEVVPGVPVITFIEDVTVVPAKNGKAKFTRKITAKECGDDFQVGTYFLMAQNLDSAECEEDECCLPELLPNCIAFEVVPKEIDGVWDETEFTFDGAPKSPEVEFEGVLIDDKLRQFYVYFQDGKRLDGAPSEPGTYTVRVIIRNPNYEYVGEDECEFEIVKFVTPPTGDNNHIVLWSIVAIIATGALFVLLKRRTKLSA